MSESIAAPSRETAQSPYLQKLARILTAERNDGCRNRMVVGGLDRFLAVWLREVEAATGHAGRPTWASAVVDHLQDYAGKPAAERAVVIEQALRAVEACPPEPAAVQQPAPAPGTAVQRRRRPPARPEFTLQSPVTTVPGIATALANKLQQLGVHTIADLLYLFPHRYEDFSRQKKISELLYGEQATIAGVVQEVRNQQTARGIRLTKLVVSDGTGFIQATWFNQPFLVRQLPAGRRIALSGRVEEYMGRLTLHSPQWEPWTQDLTHTGRMVPIYPLTEGLTVRRLRTLIKPVVARWAPRLIDSLPADLRSSYNLIDLEMAIRQIHFPDDQSSLERARYRLCFEEFLLIQLGVMKQRVAWQQQPGRPLDVDQTLLEEFIAALPFVLTEAQRRVLGEITTDLQRAYPMSRLLQGDVGSGKTVVALVAMLVAVANGMQAVMMAPTEVLAEQHFHTLTRLLQNATGKLSAERSALARVLPRVQVGLLMGRQSPAEKQECRAQIAAGEINVIVGTHALIQEQVGFQALGLAIIDEQHRFGVSQRAALRQKGYNPHTLVMSATPIPRTLALTIYGDLDISIINELPPHRQKIITRWLEPNARERAHAFVREQVQKGRQAFVICPLIQESDKIVAKAAVTEYERLRDAVFPDLRLGLLHGRMKGADKEKVMARFVRGALDILVSTAVVEVGIDVPNATVMLVEGADRFGLAQLHQFRGRVGRSEHRSYCLLLAEAPTTEGGQRLKVIETTHDGFVLAEEDLKMRGPGEFFGTRQAGLPDLKVARLSDTRVLEQARKAATELFREDPGMSRPDHQLLAQKMQVFWEAETDLS